jgi:thiol:disulfide interchange protein DsbD
MGLTMGLVAAPCIGPFVVGLLAFVGATGDPILGFWLFFVMALGLGLPTLLLGIFSGALASLPRSGVWLIYAKKVMGVALLGVALFFAQPFLADRVLGWAGLALALGAGLYLGLFDRTLAGARRFLPVRLTTGVAVVLAGAWLTLPLVQAKPALAWEAYDHGALARAGVEGRPLIIDFSADWCLPCRELERFTFTDPRVIDEAARFRLLKADLTQFESAPVRQIRDRFDVIGVPTIVFLDSRGEERRDLRLFGFEPPAAFLERMRQVR